MATYADQLAACDAQIAKFTEMKAIAGRTMTGPKLAELLELKKYLTRMAAREANGGRLTVTLGVAGG